MIDPGEGYSTMVMVQREAVAPPLSAITATLSAMSVRHGADAVQGLPPGLIISDTTGWVPATELVTGAAVPDLLDTARRRWKAQPHAAAALAWKCYTYWVALPAVLGYAAARRVPLPRATDVLVRYSSRPPFLRVALRQPTVAVLAGDPVAAMPGVEIATDDAALLARLRTALLDDHLGPIAEKIRERVHLGQRTLLGSLASGVAYGLARAADTLPGSTLETISTVLAAFDVDDLVDVHMDPTTGDISVQRRTCCLAFTLPQPRVCKGCCIRTS